MRVDGEEGIVCRGCDCGFFRRGVGFAEGGFYEIVAGDGGEGLQLGKGFD